MSNLDDINKLMKDMMGNFPFDTVGVEKAFKSSALLNEKLANVALDAASKSTEISTTWAKNTIGKLQAVSSAKEEPANYVAAMTEFASNQAELASENVTAFTEIAKRYKWKLLKLLWQQAKK